MAFDNGNALQDYRGVALFGEHERRRFIDQYVKDDPGTEPELVESALEKAAAKVASFGDREALKIAIDELIGHAN